MLIVVLAIENPFHALSIDYISRQLGCSPATLTRSIARFKTLAGLEFAGRFTRYSLPALELGRRAVQRGRDASLSEGLAIEADLSTIAYRTVDAEEGMAAFEEKRKPEFRDE